MAVRPAARFPEFISASSFAQIVPSGGLFFDKSAYEFEQSSPLADLLRSLLGRLPKWPGLSNFLKGGQHLMKVFPAASKPNVVKTSAKELP